MHVILATIGTDGDVFPFIGLGSVLRKRGYCVTLAAPEPYRTRASDLGFEFCPIVTSAEVSRLIEDPDLWHPIRSGRMMARWGGPMIPRHYEILARLAHCPESVIVSSPGVLAARLVQEKLGCPMATLLLQPGLLPSSTAPPEMTGGLTIPSWFPQPLRWLYWLSVDVAGYLLVAKKLNAVRMSLGLRPVRRLFRWWLSPDLVIGLFPEWYAAPQPDWPPQFRLAGFGRFDGVREELSDDVRAFCQAGTRPIAFTLGTGMTHAARFFRTSVSTCEALGARGILLTKYQNLIPAKLPARIHICKFAPFRKLLPHCSALVHHGGIGTTAAAIDSGCPQLVLPLAWDQPDNAARVERLGVGITLGSRQRNCSHITRALARLSTLKTQAQCQKVMAMNGEDGLEVAARWVEELVKERSERG